jgi:hypothetical protein
LVRMSSKSTTFEVMVKLCESSVVTIVRDAHENKDWIYCMEQRLDPP